MCFDICTINIRVSIRVRGLHLVLELASVLRHGNRGDISHLFWMDDSNGLARTASHQ